MKNGLRHSLGRLLAAVACMWLGTAVGVCAVLWKWKDAEPSMGSEGDPPDATPLVQGNRGGAWIPG